MDTQAVVAEQDEPTLLAAAQAGDTRAYGQLLERHQASAFRAAYLIAGSAAEAEDAVQEAAIKAWLALGRFRKGSPFRPWLVQIAINEARNRRRSAGRRAALAMTLTAAPHSSAAAPSAEAQSLGDDERRRLITAIEGLDENDKLVIAARYFLGLSETETAIALGLRRGTVKSRSSRALVRLRVRLGEESP